ncbi:hypothetical protein BGW39_001609 [Mortierella sp. 14UC]|nr:hypothetical protein BGW39_001609 [Mortierella sp. 14UC]
MATKRLEKAIRTFQHASSSLSSAAAIDAIHKESENSVLAAGCSSLPAQQGQEQQQQSSSTTSPADLSSSLTIPAQPHPSQQQNQKQYQEEEEIHFDIHWRPFQLDPNAPRIPIRKTRLYHRKFGPEKALKVQDRVAAAGKVEGIQFLHTDQSLYSNTIDSHRMLRFARERLGRLPSVSNERMRAQEEDEEEVVGNGAGKKMVDSGNSNGTPHDQDPQDYFPTYNPATNTSSEHDEGDEDDEDEEEVDELGARMENAMVDELFRSHFERGECSEFETLKSCARSVLIQTAAFSAAAAAALSSTSSFYTQPPPSTSSASPLQDQQQTSPRHADTNTNNTNQHLPPSLPSEEYTRLLKAKEQELIEQQLQEIDQYLHSDEGLDEVMGEIRIAKEDLGMQGVPMIIIQNEYLLSGSQTPATFVQVLKRVI